MGFGQYSIEILNAYCIVRKGVFANNLLVPVV